MQHTLSLRWLVALLLVVWAGASAAEQFQDLNGEPRSLDDYTGKGKWLVVMIWASDCHICNAEAQQYDIFHGNHMKTDATVLGISMDGAAGKQEAAAFVERHLLTFPNLIGEPEDVADLYSASTGRPWIGTPTFLIYGPDGRLRAEQVGAVPTELIEEFIVREAQSAQPKG
ncbi:MAG: hypothetical protein AMS22_04195 [Thiotrichales bacterium SG8_50]|nr:MAG: hypothetical protein AMS22_04195 [Thiotrichales bacterium SG8_50]